MGLAFFLFYLHFILHMILLNLSSVCREWRRETIQLQMKSGVVLVLFPMPGLDTNTNFAVTRKEIVSQQLTCGTFWEPKLTPSIEPRTLSLGPSNQL